MRHTYRIPRGFISIDSGTVECPHCRKVYIDSKDKYTNAINKSKVGFLTKRCKRHKCKKKFGIGVDMVDGLVGFKL